MSVFNSAGTGSVGGKSLWDAAKEVVANREKGKLILYICTHLSFVLLAETAPTESNTVLFVGSRSGVGVLEKKANF